MTVALDAGHLYVNMDSTHEDKDSSAALVGSGCATLNKSAEGRYVVTVPLDGCGTTVTQANNKLSFTNTIKGSAAALMIDNIITTESLELAVQCDYSDSFDLLVSDIGITTGGHDLDSFDNTGVMNTQFSLKSYTDSDFQTESDDSTNTVVIGEPVYNRVEVSGSIPTNVDYVVKQCVAMNAASMQDADKTYDIFKNGCLDNLVDTTQLTTNLRGDHETSVDFKFNGFTFESSSDTLFLECEIVLCALDASGMFQEATCGFDDSDLATSCDTAGQGKALGLTAAADLQST
jgi:hypothetical protein